MSKIMISELQETTSAPDSSYIAIDNGTTTNKITIANYNENANATAKRYAEASQGYSNDALTAKDGAVSAKNEAETLANTASSYANAARASADAAAGSASEASGYVGSAQTSATNALASARAAEASAAGIDDQVKLAKSWAVGNTGVRADEAVNNSMYWAGQAAAAAGGGVVSFNGRTGSVLPNAGDYSSDQIAHVNSNSTYTNVETALNEAQTNIAEAQEDITGKLNTYSSDATQWDTTPTANSTKPVTSGGIKTQFNAVTNELADITNILGSKNILPNGASTVTTNGITFTVNANGTVKATGTATADAILVLSSSFYVGNGRKVILSGCPSGGSTSKYFLYLTNANGTTSKGNDVGSGITVTADADNLGCRILIRKNQALGTAGITFSPMVRPANIRNASYVPYAMTNRELSSQISNLSKIETITATGVQYAFRMGRIVSFTFEITLTNAIDGTVLVSGLPRPRGIVYCSFITITNLAVPCILDTDGKLKIYYPNSTISGRVDGALMYLAYE